MWCLFLFRMCVKTVVEMSIYVACIHIFISLRSPGKSITVTGCGLDDQDWILGEARICLFATSFTPLILLCKEYLRDGKVVRMCNWFLCWGLCVECPCTGLLHHRVVLKHRQNCLFHLWKDISQYSCYIAFIVLYNKQNHKYRV